MSLVEVPSRAQVGEEAGAIASEATKPAEAILQPPQPKSAEAQSPEKSGPGPETPAEG